MYTTDDTRIAIIQWPSRLLGVGLTLEAAAKAARKQLHPSLAAALPQISRGVRRGDIRWGTISLDHALECEGADSVQLDMLHTRPGHILAWLPDEEEDEG